jgi:hypothetical protein
MLRPPLTIATNTAGTPIYARPRPYALAVVP